MYNFLKFYFFLHFLIFFKFFLRYKCTLAHFRQKVFSKKLDKLFPNRHFSASNYAKG